jgi:hypothetical protein
MQIIVTKEDSGLTVGGLRSITEAISFGGENTQQYSATSTVEVLSLSVFLRENHGTASSFRFQVSSLSIHKPLDTQ